jgi:DNA-binding MarR family transcriptional regulator
MLQLKDIPDEKILKKFAERYDDVDSRSVTHFLNILRIGTELAESLDRFLATHGLLQGRWWVLILLMREDDLTSKPSELAEKAGVSRATMSGLINGLLRDGLVACHDDDEDRRSYSIRLTAAGQKKLDEVMPDYYPRVKKMMSAIPEQQREDLLSQLMLLKEQSKLFG